MYITAKGQSGVPDLANNFATSCQHPDSYVGSLAYYLLTGRKGTTIYQEDDSYVVVAAHPHLPDRLLVFPEINGDGTLTAKVLNTLSIPSNGLQLARYTEQDLQKLQMALAAIPSSKMITAVEVNEKILDWKYPVRILSTEKIAHLEGKAFDKIRNKFNKAAPHVETIPLHSEAGLRAMRSSLMFWVGSMIFGEKETGHDLMEFYQTLFQAIKEYPAMFDGMVFLAQGEPAGFTIWDQPVDGTANAIASLSRLSVKGMAEYQTITVCRHLYEHGIHFYNMGGSEEESLDKYKLKYHPEHSVQIRSYEVYLEDTLRKNLIKWDLPKLNSN